MAAPSWDSNTRMTTHRRQARQNPDRLLDVLRVANTSVRYKPLDDRVRAGRSRAGVIYIRERPRQVDGDVARRPAKPWSASSKPARSSAKAPWPAQRRRRATAETITGSTIRDRQDRRDAAAHARGRRPRADWFRSHLLARNNRIEADLVDQLFNSERKAARARAPAAGALRRAPVAAPRPADDLTQPSGRDDWGHPVQG